MTRARQSLGNPGRLRFNNALQYQNRLRISDYRRIHAAAGWEVLDEKNRSKPVELLRSAPLAPEFRHYREEDLIVHGTWMSARTAANPRSRNSADDGAVPPSS